MKNNKSQCHTSHESTKRNFAFLRRQFLRRSAQNEISLFLFSFVDKKKRTKYDNFFLSPINAITVSTTPAPLVQSDVLQPGETYMLSLYKALRLLDRRFGTCSIFVIQSVTRAVSCEASSFDWRHALVVVGTRTNERFHRRRRCKEHRLC